MYRYEFGGGIVETRCSNAWPDERADVIESAGCDPNSYGFRRSDSES